ncbi:MAG: hypothetical protein PF588_05795 [Candidatus Kapabacteria bacterium]|jgi:hypothetical protein|nr:hypothetical protein [Candidatus Kapabacteria bacterium]
MYNVLSEKVKILYAKDVVEASTEKISSDIETLGSGNYLIVFKTGAYMQSEHFIIMK